MERDTEYFDVMLQDSLMPVLAEHHASRTNCPWEENQSDHHAIKIIALTAEEEKQKCWQSRNESDSGQARQYQTTAQLSATTLCTLTFALHRVYLALTP